MATTVQHQYQFYYSDLKSIFCLILGGMLKLLNTLDFLLFQEYTICSQTQKMILSVFFSEISYFLKKIRCFFDFACQVFSNSIKLIK